MHYHLIKQSFFSKDSEEVVRSIYPGVGTPHGVYLTEVAHYLKCYLNHIGSGS
jgi:hypothetical protein